MHFRHFQVCWTCDLKTWAFGIFGTIEDLLVLKQTYAFVLHRTFNETQGSYPALLQDCEPPLIISTGDLDTSGVFKCADRWELKPSAYTGDREQWLSVSSPGSVRYRLYSAFLIWRGRISATLQSRNLAKVHIQAITSACCIASPYCIVYRLNKVVVWRVFILANGVNSTDSPGTKTPTDITRYTLGMEQVHTLRVRVLGSLRGSLST